MTIFAIYIKYHFINTSPQGQWCHWSWWRSSCFSSQSPPSLWCFKGEYNSKV